MIGRKSKRETEVKTGEPKWFDDFDLRLGDVMRGERATLGKSLLDVQRDLRIKASYIAAIENCDPSAFDTPGFIAGYVRSYARYLNMDPDKAFAAFCAESGFTTAHGMSAAASTIRKPEIGLGAPKAGGKGLGASDPDRLLKSGLGSAAVARDSLLMRVDPRALGSLAVLVALAGALGFGGWTILNQVQRVQVAPVEHAPAVLAELDPLAAVTPVDPDAEAMPAGNQVAGVFTPPSDARDRLFRPQALDEPVLLARDAPISTLDPAAIGTFADAGPAAGQMADPGMAEAEPQMPQVMAEAPTGTTLFAVRPAWIKVSAADGTVLFSGTLDAGGEFTIPADVERPRLQAGMSGSVYFEVDGELYGPAGNGTAVVRKLSLARADLLETYQPADFAQDPELSKVISRVAEAEQLQD